MKVILKTAAVASLLALGACGSENKAAENQAEAVEANGANAVDAVDANASNQIEAIESNTANEAEAIREAGDNAAANAQ